MRIESGAGHLASVRRVGFLSVHTSPLEQPGAGDSGGLNVCLLELARRLTQQGVGVEIFTRAASRDLPPTMELDGVRIHHLPAGPPGAAKSELATHLCAFYLAFAAHPASRALDVVHGHYWMGGWVGRLARRRQGLPFAQSFHTLARDKNAALAPGEQPEPLLRLAAETRVVAEADAVIAPTATEASRLREAYDAAPGRVHVVQPGVDLSVFHPNGDREATREALGGGRLVLFAGRLQPLKGPGLAVRALRALEEVLPESTGPVRLIIVGGPSGVAAGSDPAGLRALASELGIADRVAVLAPRPHRELAALYRAADVVVVPSRSESFGLVALEAQACATPVVAARVGGLVHVLDGGGGTLVEGRDPRDWAAAIAPFLADERLRQRTGQAGVRRAMAFGWERTADATMTVYEKVVARRSIPAAPAAPSDARRGA
jgi:D-inositol-3-phosphate glycosyltransferase